MKIDKRYYCFGCEEKGDAVDYVAKMFGLSLKDAAIKICEDFGLSYDKGNVRYQPKGKAPKGCEVTGADIQRERMQNLSCSL